MTPAPAPRQRLELASALAGALAFAAIGLGCLWSALGYTGAAGEPYSPLNHWISELGQVGVSSRAAVFNAALVAGGGAFVLFVVGLAATSSSRLRWAFGPTGAVAGVGGLLVGVFPMNHPDQHVAAAAVFFGLGWIFVALASVAFARQRDPRHPAWLGFAGVVPVGAFLAFMVSLRVDAFARERMASSGPITDRPAVWIAPILEWAALGSIMVWVLLASLAWWRQVGRETTRSGARATA